MTMRANEIYKLDEVKMSGLSFRDVLNDPNIYLGYELEFIGLGGVPVKKILTWKDLIKHKNFDEIYYTIRKSTKYKKEYVQSKIEKALTYKKEKLVDLLFDYYQSSNTNWKEFYNTGELLDFLNKKASNKTSLVKLLKGIFARDMKEDKNFIAWLFKNQRLDAIKDINLEIYWISEWDMDDYPSDEMPKIIFNDDEIYVDYLKSYKDVLKKEFGFKFGRNKSTWKMEDDDSIEDFKDNENGFELISPPMPIKESLDILMKLFDWMERSNIRTNETTGLHMGISFEKKEQTKKVDPLKLLMFIDERYVLKLFKRTANEFAEAHEGMFQEIKFEIRDDPAIKSNKVKKFLALVRNRLSDEKHHSLNIGSLGRGYFEVRMAGNKDYHKRHSDVKNTALRYGKALQVAYSDEHTKEYVKKVYKMLQRVMGKAEVLDIKNDAIGTRLSRVANKTIWDSYTKLKSGGKGNIQANFKEFIKSFYVGNRVGPIDHLDFIITKSNAVTLLNILNAIVKKYKLNNALKRGKAAQLVKDLKALD